MFTKNKAQRLLGFTLNSKTLLESFDAENRNYEQRKIIGKMLRSMFCFVGKNCYYK